MSLKDWPNARAVVPIATESKTDEWEVVVNKGDDYPIWVDGARFEGAIVCNGLSAHDARAVGEALIRAAEILEGNPNERAPMSRTVP